MKGYLFFHLSDKQKTIYDRILFGIEHLERNLITEGSELDGLTALEAISAEACEYFWFAPEFCKVFPVGDGGICIELRYFYKGDAITRQQKLLDARIEEVFDIIGLDFDQSDFVKVSKIHDYLIGINDAPMLYEAQTIKNTQNSESAMAMNSYASSSFYGANPQTGSSGVHRQTTSSSFNPGMSGRFSISNGANSRPSLKTSGSSPSSASFPGYSTPLRPVLSAQPNNKKDAKADLRTSPDASVSSSDPGSGQGSRLSFLESSSRLHAVCKTGGQKTACKTSSQQPALQTESLQPVCEAKGESKVSFDHLLVAGLQKDPQKEEEPYKEPTILPCLQYEPLSNSISCALNEYEASPLALARTFVYLCQKAQVESILCAGFYEKDFLTFDQKHVWNIALVDGDYYYVDLSLDRSNRIKRRNPRKWFLVSEWDMPDHHQRTSGPICRSQALDPTIRPFYCLEEQSQNSSSFRFLA